MPQRRTETLIIGAGPFGLSLAAALERRRLEYLMVGQPMSFWREHMPAGMLLRSGADWHLDPAGEATFQAFFDETGAQLNGAPISRAMYLDYCDWFGRRYGLEPEPLTVTALNRSGGGFEAESTDGSTIAARQVVVAVGFQYFSNPPPEYDDIFPAGRVSHTCDLVDFAPLEGRRVLIIGGRQSAMEWACLIHEAGAASVDVVHRHDTPAFTESDWDWVTELVEGMVGDPAWFRNLSAEEREEVNRRLWAEGRLKLEPWLGPRLAHPSVRLWPRSKVAACRDLPGGALELRLESGDKLEVDEVILATGYKVDTGRIPFIAAGNLARHLAATDGFPELDEHFQSNIPGLYFTSMAATRAFGPFLAFTVSARASASIIAEDLAKAAVPQP